MRVCKLPLRFNSGLFALNDRRSQVFLLIVCASLVLLPFVITAEGAAIKGSGAELPGLCASQSLFGAICPGCGLTRSFAALCHGDVSAAIAAHPGGALVYLYFVFQVFYRGYCLRMQGKPRSMILIRIQQISSALVIILLVAVWGLRVLAC